MRLHSPKDCPYEKLRAVGVGLVDGEQTHVGVLYKRVEGVYICHLAFHHIVCNEKIDDDKYYWAECEWLDDASSEVLVGRLITVHRSLRIPYGFRTAAPAFDHNFKYEPPPIGQGLTCATFVTSIFSSLGLDLIDSSTWESRDSDIEWQKKIIKFVETRDPEQAIHMQNDIGAFRFRPEEVAAAAISDDIPVDFGTAVERAQALLNSIR